MKLPPGSIDIRNALHIQFPDVWDMIINYKLPTCYLYDTNNITNYVSSCLNFGNTVSIQLTQTDFIGNPYYYLVLDNIRNPDYATCAINKWVISITSSSFVFARSHPMYFNMPHLPLVKNPNQVTLMWLDLTTGNEVTTLPITTGSFTAKLALAADQGAFLRTFNIFSINPHFTTNPNPVTASLGNPYTTLYITANNNQAP